MRVDRQGDINVRVAGDGPDGQGYLYRVFRALLPAGEMALSRGRDVLRRLDLVRINDLVLDAAGILEPAQIRSLDAIHLATAQLLGGDLRHVVTYDDRMADAARQLGLKTASPR